MDKPSLLSPAIICVAYLETKLKTMVKQMSDKVKWEREYCPNGQLRHECPWLNNKPHGVERGYYPNGQKEFECSWNHGSKYGVEKGYHDNGQLHYETPWVNDQAHGVVRAWDKDGTLREETLCANGKIIPVNNKLSRLVLLGVSG